MEDPTLTILNLLKNNWNNANTSIAYDPEIHTGWHRHEATSPQVTVSHAEEGALRRGDTPFSGIKPDGTGPTQQFNGTVTVNCWSDRGVESSVNPKALTFEFSEEVIRIVKANYDTPTDLVYIGVEGRTFLVDPEFDPTTYRYEVVVNYGYYDTP